MKCKEKIIALILLIGLLAVCTGDFVKSARAQDFNQDLPQSIDLDKNNSQDTAIDNVSADYSPPQVVQKFYTATIKNIEEKSDGANSQTGKVKNLTLLITSGDIKGKDVQSAWVSASSEEEEIFQLKVGDGLIVQYTNVNGQENFSVVDKQRNKVLFWFLLLLIAVLVLISRKVGFKSLLTLAITSLVILYYLVPQIIQGSDPLFVSIIAVIFFIIPSLFISHGFNKKTLIAIAGIIFSIIVVAVLAKLAIDWAGFTGINSEETLYINMGDKKINLLNLLLAAIVLGTAGAMDDIALTQTAVVMELRRLDRKISWQELFSKAMRIGNDHIASVVNTLFLAYLSASLPLVLLFSQQQIPFLIAIQRELVATEILRIIIGTIGLVLTVPLTTTIAAMVFTKNLSKESIQEENLSHSSASHNFWQEK